LGRLDEISERYREDRRRRGEAFVWGGEERAEPLRRSVGGPGRRVLDLGCRDGALTRQFADGNAVVGLDADREALERAAELGIETVWTDVEEPLPFGDSEFDVVVAAEILEHVREPPRLVAEMTRVLRSGGTVTGSVPNAYRLKNRLRVLAGKPLEDNPLHLHQFRAPELLDLLSDFERPQLEYVVGRFVRVHPRLFANVIVFSARKRWQ
jgi:2-polyprenyl-3-methyl-5-hydroxy-6-metoxy-1,4-benzoquinol methylase